MIERGDRFIKKRSRSIFEFSYYYIKKEPFNFKQFMKYLEKICEHMRQTSYFFRALHIIQCSLKGVECDKHKNIRLICYGLGLFTFEFNAIHQFAFLLCIKQKLRLHKVYVYDPRFTENECTILGLTDCILSDLNFQTEYIADCVTIFYLPHCDCWLTDDTLCQNWHPDYLKNVLLINNSFDSYRTLKVDVPYLYEAFKYATEIPLKNDYKDKHIFNDLSMHTFLPKDLAKADSKIWFEKI